MAELYQSQEAVIIERAKERGIDLKQLQDYFEVKIAEISATYPDPTYSYIWRLAKVERYVWDRFCRSFALTLFATTLMKTDCSSHRCVPWPFAIWTWTYARTSSKGAGEELSQLALEP